MSLSLGSGGSGARRPCWQIRTLCIFPPPGSVGRPGHLRPTAEQAWVSHVSQGTEAGGSSLREEASSLRGCQLRGPLPGPQFQESDVTIKRLRPSTCNRRGTAHPPMSVPFIFATSGLGTQQDSLCRDITIICGTY